MKYTYIILLVFVILSANSCIASVEADLFNAALTEKDMNTALVKYQEIISIYPDSPYAIEAQYALAQDLYLCGKSEAAYLSLKEFTDKFGRHKLAQAAYYLMGVCSIEEGRPERAIEEFNKSISLNPWDESVMLARIGIADAYFLERDYNRALREYRWIFPGGEFEASLSYKIYLCYLALNNKTFSQTEKENLKKKFPSTFESSLVDGPIFPKTKENEPAENSVPMPVISQINTTSGDLGNWAIQVGSFTRVENAHSLVRRLRSENYFSWMQQAIIGADVFYRVYVGKFGTQEEAEKKAAVFGDTYDLPVRIVDLSKEN